MYIYSLYRIFIVEDISNSCILQETSLHVYLFSLQLTVIGDPVKKTSRVLIHVFESGLLSQLRRCVAPHAGAAVRDDMGILSRPVEAKSLLKIFFANHKCVWG